MGKFDGILICTDLDGTLYKNDKIISSENRAAIDYFKSEGGYFTFITGRMPYYSKDAYDSVIPNVPYGCINGGGVYDGAQNKYVWTCEIPRYVLELVECVDERFKNVGIQTCCFDKTYFAESNRFTERFRKRTNLPNFVKHYRDVTEPIAKMIFCVENEEDIFGIEQTLRDHPMAEDFTFIRSEKTLFEILPKGVTKGLALRKLTDYLNIPMEKTIAIGDYDNDVGMLTEAGIGIAVSNASIAARDAADYITVSNEEHAIAKVIFDLEKGKFGI